MFINKFLLSSLIFIILGLNQAFGFYSNIGFWSKRGNHLVYSTSTQTIYAQTCSGIVSIQNKDNTNATKNVTTTTVVNLTATSGVTYYSDSTCVTPITSVTIAASTSSISFYFLSTNAGAQTLTATSGSMTVAQTNTINASPYVWTGLGGNSNWSTAANWSGNAVPGSTSTAIFDSTCTNCNATISSAVSIGTIRMTAAYTGSISQASTLSVGTIFTQYGGTFSGGTTNITFANFNLAGGSFTSTSGTTRINGPSLTVSNSPTFNHNNGKFEFPNTQLVLNGIGGLSFYNVDLVNNSGSGTLQINDTLNVLNTLDFKNLGYAVSLLGVANINVSGDIIIEGSHWNMSDTIVVRAIGTGTITGSGTGARLGSLVIDSPGTITFAQTGSVDIGGSFTYVAGTVVTTNSLVRFAGNTQSISSGAMEFNNVSFISLNNGYLTRTITGTMKVLGSLTVTCGSYSSVLNSGTIEVGGNLNVLSSNHNGGTTLIKMIGTGTITGSGSGSYVGSLEINTPGTITFANTGSIDVGNFTYTSGTVVSTGSTVRIVLGGSTINSGSMAFNNLAFYQSATTTTNVTGTVYVNGNLALQATSYWPSLTGGTFDVKGNLSVSGNFSGGTSSIVASGSGVQTVTRTSPGNFPGAVITVNNASSVLTLASNFAMNTTQGLTVTSGSVDMAGYNLTAKTLSLNSNTLTKNAGVLIVNGTTVTSGSLYWGTVAP